MAPPRKSDVPCYGCLFCDRTFASETRCGLHLDQYLPEYSRAYGRPQSTYLKEQHPIELIRVQRKRVVGRGAAHPIIWKPLTLTIPNGVIIPSFVIPLATRDALRAFMARPPRSGNRWILDLGAHRLAPHRPVPVPKAAHRNVPVDRSTTPGAGGSRAERSGGPIGNNIVVSPRIGGVSMVNFDDSVGNAIGPHFAIGAGANAASAFLSRRRRRLETPSPPPAASVFEHDHGHLAPSPIPRHRKHVRRSGLSAEPSSRADPTPGRRHCPIILDDERDPVVVRAAQPIHVTTPIAETARHQAMMDEFFTPGNESPNYFQIKVSGTEFCVSVGAGTTLEAVIRCVQRGLLDPQGWPVLRGLKGLGDVEVWDEIKWQAVKERGAKAAALFVTVEIEF